MGETPGEKYQRKAREAAGRFARGVERAGQWHDCAGCGGRVYWLFLRETPFGWLCDECRKGLGV
jgi:hypothetical protein